MIATAQFEVVYDNLQERVEDIKELFENEFWTDKRDYPDIEKMLLHSGVNIGIMDRETDKLIGFARVLTDFTYLALITDVMVHKDYRNQGIGRMIMDGFIQAPQLQQVSQLELYCRDDKVAFYEKWGFQKSELLNFMRIKR